MRVTKKHINFSGWHWTKLENHPPGIALYLSFSNSSVKEGTGKP
jgi:hypothetical protein